MVFEPATLQAAPVDRRDARVEGAAADARPGRVAGRPGSDQKWQQLGRLEDSIQFTGEQVDAFRTRTGPGPCRFASRQNVAASLNSRTGTTAPGSTHRATTRAMPRAARTCPTVRTPEGSPLFAPGTSPSAPAGAGGRSVRSFFPSVEEMLEIGPSGFL